MDVYKTHRTCAYPDYILKGAVKECDHDDNPHRAA